MRRVVICRNRTTRRALARGWHALNDDRREGRGERRSTWSRSSAGFAAGEILRSETLATPFLPVVSQGVPPNHSGKPTATLRAGFSLFEVIISLAIFAFSVAAIGQLVSSGVRGAVQSRLQTQAMFLFESKLSELVAGITPLQAARATPFPDDTAWTWSVELQSGPQPDLYVVRVTVDHASASQTGSLTYSLSRVIRDPVAVAAMEQQKAQLLQQYQQSQSTSSTTSGSGSSASSGGSR